MRYHLALRDHVLSIFWNITTFGCYEQLLSIYVVLVLEHVENFTNRALRFHVSVVWSSIDMVKPAAEDAGLDGVVHRKVSLVVWVSHVSSDSKTR